VGVLRSARSRQLGTSAECEAGHTMIVVEVGNGLESITEPGTGLDGMLYDPKDVPVRSEPLILHATA
jgi:hypothetical protein